MRKRKEIYLRSIRDGKDEFEARRAVSNYVTAQYDAILNRLLPDVANINKKLEEDQIENFQLFGSYFGIKDLSDECALITVALEKFIELRKEARREVKMLYRIAKHIKYLETHAVGPRPTMADICNNGLCVTIYRSNEAHFSRRLHSIIGSLAYISKEYRNSKIHALELEIAYLNRNIKVIKAAIKRRKSTYESYENSILYNDKSIDKRSKRRYSSSIIKL